MLARARADDDRYRVGEQPARGEQDRLRRWLIEPLGIVEQHAERPALGCGGEHAERRRSDREPLAADAGSERQCRPQGRGLRRREGVDMLDHGAQQLEQARERNRRLLLAAARREHEHLARRGGCVGQQGALADARLSTHDEHAARADACVGEQALDRRALRIAPDQHRPSMPEGGAAAWSRAERSRGPP